MNRVTRLSMIAVMALSTTALGILGWNAMYPRQPVVEQPKLDHPPPQPIEIPDTTPKPNPEYVKLQEDLKKHEQHCLALSKQTTIIVRPQSQTGDQSVQTCWNLVKVEKDYVEKFPDKTIPR
jgi:hypothetical protein